MISRLKRTDHERKTVNCLESEPRNELARFVDPGAPEGGLRTSRVHPTDVLAELSVLLEEYAPTWYPERLRHRILAALRLPTEVLVEVCALLEDHAPAWYTDQQRCQALYTLKTLGLLESEASKESTGDPL
jgi:hypothetical protein